MPVEVLYSDSMSARLPYLSTILEAARASGRSEREISRTATGQPAALSLIKTGRVPSVERVRQLCEALGLEFYVGPRREQNPSALHQEVQMASGNRTPHPGSLAHPRVRGYDPALREPFVPLVDTSSRRSPDTLKAVETTLPYETSSAEYVELREIGKGGTEGRLAFRRGWLERHGLDPAECNMVGVRDDSMEPIVPDGSSVLIDGTQEAPRNGRIYMVRIGEDLVARRAIEEPDGLRLLVSDRPGWPSTPWPEGAHIIGEVRWVARLLDWSVPGHR